MDLSFARPTGVAVAAPSGPAAFAQLVAGVAGAQAAGPTAAAAMRMRPACTAPGDVAGALALLFAHRGEWRAATAQLGGSFHPRVAAAAAGKARSTLMKAGFTFAF